LATQQFAVDLQAAAEVEVAQMLEAEAAVAAVAVLVENAIVAANEPN